MQREPRILVGIFQIGMCLKALPKTRIMNLFVFSTFICLLVSYVAAVENTVPVFMLDYDHVMAHVQVDRNPFLKVPSNDFAKIVEESAKYKVIIFLEETLSIEDISTKDKFYGTPYKNLQANLLLDKNKVKYFPSVIQPCYVLRKTFPPKDSNMFYLAQRTKLQLKDSLKYIYMYFKDTEKESKADTLKRHDNIIKEVMTALRAMKAGPIIAYYTGKLNPVIVKKVDVPKESKTETRKKGLVFQTPRVLFQLFGVYSTQQTRRFYYDQQPTVIEEIPSVIEKTPSKHKLTAKFKLENLELKWQFVFYALRWEIDALYMFEDGEQVGHVALRAGARQNWSYYCTEPVNIVNVRTGNYLTIDSMLVDAANQNAPAGQSYNPLEHCAPLFSSESLSCFVCGGLLFCLLIFAVMMLTDLKSFDRYDDPNGKPLIHEKLH